MLASVPTFSEFTTCVTPAHYCMIVDSSSSIFSGKKLQLWEREKSVIKKIAEGFDIGPGLGKSKVALVKYGGEVVREFNFSTYNDTAAVLEAIGLTVALTDDARQGTVTPEAIKECVKIFKEQGQTGVPKVIMVFSDGVTHFPKNHPNFKKGIEEDELNKAVNNSTAEETINYAVIFIKNAAKRKRAMNEALIIAQKNEKRAFVDETLGALEQTIINELACGKYNVLTVCAELTPKSVNYCLALATCVVLCDVQAI